MTEKENSKIAEDVKKEALIMAEKATRDIVDGVFKLIEVAVKDSENKIDDMILGVLPTLKNIVISYVDKISPDIEAN